MKLKYDGRMMRSGVWRRHQSIENGKVLAGTVYNFWCLLFCLATAYFRIRFVIVPFWTSVDLYYAFLHQSIAFAVISLVG